MNFEERMRSAIGKRCAFAMRSGQGDIGRLVSMENDWIAVQTDGSAPDARAIMRLGEIEGFMELDDREAPQ